MRMTRARGRPGRQRTAGRAIPIAHSLRPGMAPAQTYRLPRVLPSLPQALRSHRTIVRRVLPHAQVTVSLDMSVAATAVFKLTDMEVSA